MHALMLARRWHYPGAVKVDLIAVAPMPDGENEVLLFSLATSTKMPANKKD